MSNFLTFENDGRRQQAVECDLNDRIWLGSIRSGHSESANNDSKINMRHDSK